MQKLQSELPVPEALIATEAPVLPLYEQLHYSMLNKISSRDWKPGQRIPSEMELCEMYGVSRITVRKAIEDMVRTGHLKRYRGRGTFVQTELIENKLSKFFSFSETLKSKGLNELAEVLTFEVISADTFLAEKLRLDDSHRMAFKIMRLRSVDEIPYAVETSYIPQKLLMKLTEALVAENGLYAAMRALGVAPDRAQETFHAASLGGLEARLLQQTPQAPVMSIERLTYSGTAHVEYCCSIVRGDFFAYTVELDY